MGRDWVWGRIWGEDNMVRGMAFFLLFKKIMLELIIQVLHTCILIKKTFG